MFTTLIEAEDETLVTMKLRVAFVSQMNPYIGSRDPELV